MAIAITHSIKLLAVLEQNPTARLPIDEFEAYKNECVDFQDIPNPDESIQRQYPSHLETIGRDRLATRPLEARFEEVHHAHVWQEGCIWEDDDGDLKVQWSCTSDSYVVYSYFIDIDRNHHFHIIDYCFDRAHRLIEDEEQVTEWALLARTHRLLFQ